MQTYNLITLTHRLSLSKVKVFTKKTLGDYLDVSNDSSLDKIARRLIKSGVILRGEKGKYLVQGNLLESFTIANFLRTPSYVSFETALNHHGILSQFPYEISSATPRKSGEKHIDKKLYTYMHLQNKLFWGYFKQNDYLIAEPEKALLDQLYLHLKGLRGFPLDEYDLSRIQVSKLREYLGQMPLLVRKHPLSAQLIKESGHDRPVSII